MDDSYLKAVGAADIKSQGDRLLYRFFEVLPGGVAWFTIAGIFVFSWLLPVFTSFFIIAFDLYWLFKTVFLSIHLRAGYREMRRRMKINWREKLDGITEYPSELGVRSWRDIRHLVILPFYKESYVVVSEAVEAIRNSDYPHENLWVVLAAEERAGDEARVVAENIEKENSAFFGRILAVVHPANLPGEMPGKGSNETWAARRAKEEILDKESVPLEHVLVSSLDIDTQIPPGYFSVLTHEYLTSSKPLRSSYQPIPVYNNNIWDSPAFSRVVAVSGTFWQTMQQSRPERLTTFSSHSMPMKALVEIGYWQTNIVSEDSRIFWQAFLFYDGDWRTVPLFYPVSMDANVGPTLRETAKNVYIQQRRWGWGVENVPYTLFGFWKNKKIPLQKKIYFAFNQLEGFWAWATNAFILFFLGWLPVILGGTRFGTTVLSHNLPRITRSIMTLAMFGLVTSAIISVSLLPKRPVSKPIRTRLWMVLQWVLLPFTIVLFGSLPGLEAQTRLMFGWRLGFWVTPKYRHQKPESR
ncbi:MAG: glycosyltransferase family 2 protein [Candidatus Sungbacteria bacterium]|nr:glycosyltransferase family 2 protein [Candidatus Sungbacteria bacterium]